jgi:apolipoprotein N-acyltransferase
VISGLVLVARAAARQWTNAAAALVFPVLYAALSFAFSRTAYDGTWANPAYRVDGLLPLLQIASVTGIWGIVFAMTLPASGIALAWYRVESGQPWRTAAGVALAIFGGVLLFGAMRLALAAAAPSVRVAMIASDRESVYSRTTNESKAADLLDFYASQVSKAAAQGAQVVVLPEKIVGVTARDRSVLVKLLSGTASSSRVWLIAGTNEIGRMPKINAAWVFSADGALVDEYHKHYFVRGFENGYQAGDRIYAVDAPWGRTGVAICKDLDYPWFIRRYGAADVRLILVPAWDWEGPNAVMHERMALVRGVENGFALARSAKTGLVTAHDAFGHTLASNSTFAEDPAMVVADVPLGPGITVYSRFGDWFGWLCVALSLGIMVIVFM